jgi:hypothetical protein
MPVCPAERSGQPGEKRQGRDRVDRREERSKILANLDQEWRHGKSAFLALYKRRIKREAKLIEQRVYEKSSRCDRL